MHDEMCECASVLLSDMTCGCVVSLAGVVGSGAAAERGRRLGCRVWCESVLGSDAGGVPQQTPVWPPAAERLAGPAATAAGCRRRQAAQAGPSATAGRSASSRRLVSDGCENWENCTGGGLFPVGMSGVLGGLAPAEGWFQSACLCLFVYVGGLGWAASACRGYCGCQ